MEAVEESNVITLEDPFFHPLYGEFKNEWIWRGAPSDDEEFKRWVAMATMLRFTQAAMEQQRYEEVQRANRVHKKRKWKLVRNIALGSVIAVGVFMTGGIIPTVLMVSAGIINQSGEVIEVWRGPQPDLSPQGQQIQDLIMRVNNSMQPQRISNE